MTKIRIQAKRHSWHSRCYEQRGQTARLWPNAPRFTVTRTYRYYGNGLVWYEEFSIITPELAEQWMNEIFREPK